MKCKFPRTTVNVNLMDHVFIRVHRCSSCFLFDKYVYPQLALGCSLTARYVSFVLFYLTSSMYSSRSVEHAKKRQTCYTQALTYHPPKSATLLYISFYLKSSSESGYRSFGRISSWKRQIQYLRLRWTLTWLQR